MPVIKIWGLEPNEPNLSSVRLSVVAAVLKVEGLKLANEREVTVVFAADNSYGPDVIVEIDKLSRRPERTPEVCKRLAAAVGQVVHSFVSESNVECFVSTFDPECGFWRAEAQPCP